MSDKKPFQCALEELLINQLMGDTDTYEVKQLKAEVKNLKEKIDELEIEMMERQGE